MMIKNIIMENKSIIYNIILHKYYILIYNFIHSGSNLLPMYLSLR